MQHWGLNNGRCKLAVIDAVGGLSLAVEKVSWRNAGGETSVDVPAVRRAEA
jgi:hypothetical protein